MCQNIDQFLSKAIKDLSRSKIEKLIKRREIRAKNTAFQREAENFMISNGISKCPSKKPFENRRQISRYVNHTSLTEVGEGYGNLQHAPDRQELIECGAGKQGDKRRKGCGKLIPLEGAAG
jgi:hypothetical protein